MTDWIALSPQRHRDAAWLPREGYGHARSLQAVDILVQELSSLLPHYQLAFLSSGDDYRPVALLGTGGRGNLYVNGNGQWLASYVPAALRGFPFTLADRGTDGADRRVLCLHREHLLADPAADGRRSAARSLFNEDGTLARDAQRSFEFLQHRERGLATTRAATSALAEAGLLKPWTLTLPRGDGQPPLRLEGLHAVDERRLNHLDADTFAGLRAAGALSLAYAQVFTMSQTDHLLRRMTHLGQQQMARAVTEELGELFDDGQTLNFDQFK